MMGRDKWKSVRRQREEEGASALKQRVSSLSFLPSTLSPTLAAVISYTKSIRLYKYFFILSPAHCTVVNTNIIIIF